MGRTPVAAGSVVAGRVAAIGAVAGVVLAGTVAGCSSGGDEVAVTAPAPVGAACSPADPVLRVDAIADAVAAVEAELGGAQRYYEINATDLLVNLFVAGDGGAEAIPFVFVGGALTSDEPLAGASGSTFAADQLDFDPRRVTSCVAAELPDSVPTVFEVVGGPAEAVRYSVVVTSQAGGQLIVEVAPNGAVLSGDAV